MDLSAPYSAVVPSLDGPVLRALAATDRPLTGLEVHRLAGIGSDNGVRKVLARLVDHGLVTVTEAGPSLLYLANRHHLAWPAVQSLMTIRQRLFDRLTSFIDSWEVQPALAGVFGSAARGDGTTASDIDLLIVRPGHIRDPDDESADAQAQQWADRVSELRDMARSSTGNYAQIIELSVASLDEAVQTGEPIVAEWRRDLVLLAGNAPWHPAAQRRRPSGDGGGVRTEIG